MSTNAVERTAEEAKAAAHSVAEAATQIASQAERSFAEAAKRFEKVVAEGLEPEKAADRAFPRLIWKRKSQIARQLRLWQPDTAMTAIEQLAEAEILTRRTEIPADAAVGRALLLVAAQARRAGARRA